MGSSGGSGSETQNSSGREAGLGTPFSHSPRRAAPSPPELRHREVEERAAGFLGDAGGNHVSLVVHRHGEPLAKTVAGGAVEVLLPEQSARGSRWPGCDEPRPGEKSQGNADPKTDPSHRVVCHLKPPSLAAKVGTLAGHSTSAQWPKRGIRPDTVDTGRNPVVIGLALYPNARAQTLPGRRRYENRAVPVVTDDRIAWNPDGC